MHSDRLTMSESERRSARVEVQPVVVVVSDGDCGVLVAVAVRVADERRLPVVVDFAP